jgi:hypothetical protein
LSWPPKVTSGQVWTVQIDGLPAWTLNFNDVTKDGDPTGPATQGNKKFAALALRYDDGWFGFAMIEETGAYFCEFENASSVNGSRLTNGLALRREKGAEKSQDLKKSCTATLVSGNASLPGSGHLEMGFNSFQTLDQIIAAAHL